jgi:hypothetical protein
MNRVTWPDNRAHPLKSDIHRLNVRHDRQQRRRISLSGEAIAGHRHALVNLPTVPSHTDRQRMTLTQGPNVMAFRSPRGFLSDLRVIVNASEGRAA